MSLSVSRQTEKAKPIHPSETACTTSTADCCFTKSPAMSAVLQGAVSLKIEMDGLQKNM